jgi:PAS domain S-box-containing protein
MHPIRSLLLMSLGIAIAVSTALGYAVERAGFARTEAVVIGVLTFIVVAGPAAGGFAWSFRRAAEIDRLAVRTMRVAAGRYGAPVGDEALSVEADDLARAIDELRAIILRQQTSFEEQRAMMGQIVASVGEGLVALSANGRIVFANARVGEMFSLTESIVGRPLIEAIRSDALVATVDRALAGERGTARIDAGERAVEVRVVPVRSSGEVAAVALFIDITQIERLQRIRKEFLDDFSHEVRTPLAGLRSAVDTFDEGGLTIEQNEQLRRIMVRQLGRIERLAKDLAELNRIESGELVLAHETIDLHGLLEELCDDFRERLSGSPLTIALRGAATLARVDPTRAQQIFANLIDNAWKHGGARGEIAVDVGAVDGEAIVTVADEGEGIPPHEIDRIFHRFYRVDKSRSTPGLGLGLAIVKHLVLLHGGSIRAYNREGGGAAFEVRLPAATF